MEHEHSAPLLTGADLEISNTARRLSDALGIDGPQAEALRVALSDHATAVGSKSTAMIAGMFNPMFGMLEKIDGRIGSLEERWEKRFDYMLGTIDKHLKHMDARLDIYGQQIDGLSARMDASEVDRARIWHQIEGLPQLSEARAYQEMKDRIVRLERIIWILFVPVACFAFLLVLAALYGGNR